MILTLHISACVLLIIFVLLQSGKEGMGVIFGGGSSSLFGSTGARGILVKLTTFVAIVFFCTSLGYSILTSSRDSSATSRIKEVNVINIEEPVSPPIQEQTGEQGGSEAARPGEGANP
jgi:preprotein translocase subunit SecG